MPIKTFRLGTKFGDYTASVEGGSALDCIEALTFLSDSPRECPICGCALILYARRAGDKQQFRYYGLRCTNDANGGMDAHEKTYGEFNDDTGTLYFKSNLKEFPWQRIGDVRGGRSEEPQDHQQRPPSGRNYPPPHDRTPPAPAPRPPQGRTHAPSQYGG